jgi:hypothetical protein
MPSPHGVEVERVIHDVEVIKILHEWQLKEAPNA